MHLIIAALFVVAGMLVGFVVSQASFVPPSLREFVNSAIVLGFAVVAIKLFGNPN